MSDGPLIVQSDKTLLLDIDHPMSVECRRAIAPFAELERSPEHIHTYRLTPLGLWNARAAGHDAEQVIDTLIKYSRYAVPHSILIDVAETMSRYGRLRLEMDPVHGLILVTTDTAVLDIDIRSFSMADLERVDAAIKGLKPVNTGTRYEITGGFNRPPLETSSTMALYERAEKVAKELGMPPLGHASVGGASDGNFAAAAGAQVLDGLGAVGDGAHAAHEWVDISTLEDRSKLLNALIKDLLNE